MYNVPVTIENEAVLRRILESDGFVVYHNGWPDFLAVKDGVVFAIEHKGSGYDKLSADQVRIMDMLTTLGITCLRWSLSTGLVGYAEPYKAKRKHDGVSRKVGGRKVKQRQLSLKMSTHGRKKMIFPSERRQAMLDLCRGRPELTYAEIGERFNISRQRVQQVLSRYGVHRHARRLEG